EEHVRRARDLVLDAYGHQHVTLAELVSQLAVVREPGHVPLVSVTFNVDRALNVLAIEGIETEGKVPKAFGIFDLAANVSEAARARRGALTYNTDIFDAEVIRAWLASWQVLLDGVARSAHQRVADVPLLSSEQQQVLLKDWNSTDGAISAACIHRQIASW